MKIEDLVLSVEQARCLQSHGMKMDDSVMCWYFDEKDEHWWVALRCAMEMKMASEVVPTYTLQELMMHQPEYLAVSLNTNDLLNSFFEAMVKWNLEHERRVENEKRGIYSGALVFDDLDESEERK